MERMYDMSGQEKEGKFAETPGEQKVESLLRHGAAWTPDAPEPLGLAYQALAKHASLTPKPRRRRWAMRSWWSLGTLSVGAALTMLLYAHPMNMLGAAEIAPAPSESPTLLPTLLPTPPAQKVASENAESVTGSGLPTIKPPLKRDAKKATDEKTPRSLLASASRLAGFTPSMRQAPQRYPRRRFDRWLVRQQRRRPKRVSVSAPPPAARGKTETLPAQNNPEASSMAQNYRVLVPVMLTHESEDGSEIIVTPLVMEMAYRDQNPAKQMIDY